MTFDANVAEISKEPYTFSHNHLAQGRVLCVCREKTLVQMLPKGQCSVSNVLKLTTQDVFSYVAMVDHFCTKFD